ncbi:MAG TPA: acyltransferase family protein, partial [Actinomycetales bacterium]|nr:acyltransferase family protein [Actinomycetales bacterium]
PFVILAAVWLARRAGWSPYRVTVIVVSGIFLASFIYANYLTATQPEVSYFHTGTRVWQLALGGLAGLILPKLRLNRGWRIACGWLGLALIATCGLILDGAAHFPGYQSLWPVGGLFLILVAGYTGSRFAADRIFVQRPVTFIADISYSLYLWHWPLFIFYLVWTGAEQLTPGGAALLLSISLLLASITTYGLEKPLNAALVAVRANRPILVGALALLVAAGGVSLFSGNHLASAQAAALSRDEIDPVSHPGAAALAGELVLPDRYSVPFPAPEAVAADIPDIYGRGCTQTHRSEAGSDEVLICEYRAPGYDISVDPTIVIIGGSKSGQWNPAFKMLAEENKWRVLTLDKGGCQFTFTSENDTEPLQSEHCQRYNNNALELLQGMKPELVVTIATTARHTGERMPDGFIAAWEALDAAGIPILAIRDTPRFNWDVAECLVQNSYDAHKCGALRSEVLPKDFSDVLAGKQLPASVTVLDMTDYFCTSDYCEAVVGNIAVYRDKHHVTVSYMDTVAPLLADKMRPEFSELFQASGG